MKKQDGVALPTLIIIIAVIIIVANYAKNMIEENKLVDLRTNMLLIQAESKKDLEEVCFQTINLDKNKEDDMAKIEQIKKENIKGTKVKGTEIEKNIPTDISINEDCYYLDDNILNEIGIKKINSKEEEYYIVKYDFENIIVEVINTKGYDGKYTLSQLIEE